MSIRLTLAAVFALGLAAPLHAAGDNGVERFSATTTNLQPDGITLRFDVLRWTDSDAGADVIAALQSDDAASAIDDVPTLGYIWPQGSPVGYSIKYARREATDSGERMTFVTNRTLGSYDFGGWSVSADFDGPDDLPYSVIELDLGESSGFASLAAAVIIDAENGIVSLDRTGAAPVLFTDVHPIKNGYQ